MSEPSPSAFHGDGNYIEDFRRYPGYYNETCNFWYWWRHLGQHGSLPYKTLGGNNSLDLTELNEVFHCPSQLPQDGEKYLDYAIYSPLGNNVRVNVPYTDRTMLLIDRANVTVGSSGVGLTSKSNQPLDIAYRHLNGTTISLYADGSQHIYTYPHNEPGGIPNKDFHWHSAYWPIAGEAP